MGLAKSTYPGEATYYGKQSSKFLYKQSSKFLYMYMYRFCIIRACVALAYRAPRPRAFRLSLAARVPLVTLIRHGFLSASVCCPLRRVPLALVLVPFLSSWFAPFTVAVCRMVCLFMDFIWARKLRLGSQAQIETPHEQRSQHNAVRKNRAEMPVFALERYTL